MSIHILFHDGEKGHGTTATEVLRKMMGGFNNDESIYKLRKQLAARHGIDDDPELSDQQFLHMMDERGIWTVGYGPRIF